jgi:two-component system, OmpR family, sensor kinase
MIQAVSKDRLTRHELSWLLAQEARGAAHALREGVTQLKQPAPAKPGPEITIISDSSASMPPVETNLDALEDAINMLSELNSGSRGKTRRGRIDLAALLYEVAPNARIAIEPGAGTEVFGEESDMRRMFHMLVNQDSNAQGGPSEVEIRRQGEWVKIAVQLGPDTVAAADVERRWMSRMATRYGGWVELEGGTQSIFLPADGASDQREVVELRKELEQAQQLGEAYARELAAVVTAGDLRSEIPPTAPPETGVDRLELLQNTASALQRVLRHWLDGLRADTAELVKQLGEQAPLAQSFSRRMTVGAELLGDLGLLTECDLAEPVRRVDVCELSREAMQSVESRAARHGVNVTARLPERTSFETRTSELRVLLRALLHHAIAATPRGGDVRLAVVPTEMGMLISVEDGGPVVPEASRTDVIQHRTDPASFGRPAGVSLLVADVIGGVLGSGAGMREGTGGRAEIWVVLRNRPD